MSSRTPLITIVIYNILAIFGKYLFSLSIMKKKRINIKGRQHKPYRQCCLPLFNPVSRICY